MVPDRALPTTRITAAAVEGGVQCAVFRIRSHDIFGKKRINSKRRKGMADPDAASVSHVLLGMLERLFPAAFFMIAVPGFMGLFISGERIS